MQTLEIDGIFLTVYYDPAQRLAFIQTFDDESGVLIRPANAEQTALAHRYFQEADMRAYWELIAAIRRDPPPPLPLHRYRGPWEWPYSLSHRKTG